MDIKKITSLWEKELGKNVFQNSTTSVSIEEKPFSIDTIKEAIKILNEKFPSEDLFKGVIITNICSPSDGAYKVKTPEGFYIFVRKHIWETYYSKYMVSESDFPYNYFIGVPIYENEGLAIKILSKAISPLTKKGFSDIILP